jgi:tripartite-type tricarboxylate transporter receptor subunit TctC
MKRRCAGFLVLLAAFGTTAAAALAQSYPSKPVHIVVPFAAGGAVDTLARLLGAKLADAFNQPVIVDNRPGAGGNLGADAVATATPSCRTPTGRRSAPHSTARSRSIPSRTSSR